MSAESKELLVELLTSVLKDHVELVLGNYIGVEMTTTMQDRLQLELDELVEMWMEHNLVNNLVNKDLRLHANYVREPPMLNADDPIRKEAIELSPEVVASIREGMNTPIEECTTVLDWGNVKDPWD